MQQGRLFTWLSFGSALPAKVAQFSVGANKALAQLRRIQRHSVSINRAAPGTGVSTINNQQANTLAALDIKKPRADAQLLLL
jgi:hypothetical protein